MQYKANGLDINEILWKQHLYLDQFRKRKLELSLDELRCLVKYLGNAPMCGPKPDLGAKQLLQKLQRTIVHA